MLRLNDITFLQHVDSFMPWLASRFGRLRLVFVLLWSLIELRLRHLETDLRVFIGILPLKRLHVLQVHLMPSLGFFRWNDGPRSALASLLLGGGLSI